MRLFALAALALAMSLSWQVAQGAEGARKRDDGKPPERAVAAPEGEDCKESRVWTPLSKDGIHDPRGPAVSGKVLQEPGDGLSTLGSMDPLVGNQVRWVGTIDSGRINPRTNINPETKFKVLDQDVFLNVGGGMPVVRFPHREHTVWLDCKNCHEELFKSKRGATKFSMEGILDGEQCGQCHGAVSFPLTECGRCHSIPQRDFDREAMKPKDGYDRGKFLSINMFGEVGKPRRHCK